jgi:nucleoside phosphorylase
MKTLVTYAIEAEFAPWRALCDMKEITVGGISAHRAQVGNATVYFVPTGIGIATARRVAEAVISSECAFCISCGFAGALTAACGLGDAVVAERAQQFGEPATMDCVRDLVVAAERDGAKRIQTLLTADHLVTAAEEKSKLSRFAQAVDMESFAILSVAHSKKVAAVAIRVISDAFDRDLPTEIDTLVDSAGNVKIGGVVRYVARHPLAVPALMRLGRESKTAADALANFLEAYIKNLSLATHGWPPSELHEVAAT